MYNSTLSLKQEGSKILLKHPKNPFVDVDTQEVINAAFKHIEEAELGDKDGTGAFDSIANTPISRIEKDNKYAMLGDEADHNKHEIAGEIANGQAELDHDRRE